ncbi:MAG: hypothetical protein AB1477_10630 [Acidobacteriota bacterium]
MKFMDSLFGNKYSFPSIIESQDSNGNGGLNNGSNSKSGMENFATGSAASGKSNDGAQLPMIADFTPPRQKQYGLSAVEDFMSRDFEQIAFEDALRIDEHGYRNDRIYALIEEYKRLVSNAIAYYEDHLCELKGEFVIRKNQGAIELIDRLNSRIELCNRRIMMAKQLSDNAEQKTGDVLLIENKYRSGFSRGIAALTEANYLQPPLP